MICELDKDEFYKCKKLINQEGHLEVKAVIEGRNPGRIFVDNNISPSTGMIWLGNNDGFFFIGNEENEVFNNHINDFIDKVIFPELKNLRSKNFIAIGNHSKWDKTLEIIFKNHQITKLNQNVYTLENGDYKGNTEPSIEHDYKVKVINKALFKNENNTLENIGFLRTKISEFWSSPDHFFQKGIGYCIVYQNRIVSLCFSAFVAGNVHGLDIETIEAHQGNKLGQKVGHYVVKDCLSSGMVPYWDFMDNNKPSNIVAKKIGLEKYFNYSVYLFPID
ncbi:GNAT family N-acetyltransferase [Pontibacillus marinus]|uniref:Acetyltransferase n=1 Tax=Pontibacillus marinus BH030004 = DSM 16465 TaxID=1385511 RepID=A0A0A5HU11_9BACI|nr:GNAT family N-acetyltransferase [Pontibacillus marinus]KGX87127.1 acetyltransferase [Pontibacillus marinus BH030004 = DSM 16465]